MAAGGSKPHRRHRNHHHDHSIHVDTFPDILKFQPGSFTEALVGDAAAAAAAAAEAAGGATADDAEIAAAAAAAAAAAGAAVAAPDAAAMVKEAAVARERLQLQFRALRAERAFVTSIKTCLGPRCIDDRPRSSKADRVLVAA